MIHICVIQTQCVYEQGDALVFVLLMLASFTVYSQK